MFIQNPKVKLNKKNKLVYAKGYYLILMRPNGEPIQGNNVRGYVRHVSLKLQGQQLIGSVKIGHQELTLSGNYGLNGYPLTAPKEIYDLGFDLPGSLYELWNLAGARLKANTEQPEMILWGNAIRELRRNKQAKTCYRCGHGNSGIIPCESCEADLQRKCDELVNEKKKHEPGIESSEKFGTPTVGTVPPKTDREPGVKFGIPTVGVSPPKEKVK